MPACVVFGASGAIGQFLLPRLATAGLEVVAVSRRPRQAMPEGPRWLVGDLSRHLPALGDPEILLSAGPLDAFASCFACNPKWRPARIVAISSLSVESKRDSADDGERTLAARLAAAEAELQEAARARGSSLTILRPTLVYGSGRDRSLAPLVGFARRWRVFPRVPGARGLRQPVHADDVAAACMAALAAPCSAGMTYAIGGGERLSFAAMLERLRASLPFRVLPVPLPLAPLVQVRRLMPLAGLAPSAEAVRRLQVDLVADHAAAERDLAWAPRPFAPDPASWPRS